jgi:Cys-tRNA(Pro)/Cys-tRNA(Cys) deacylase
MASHGKPNTARILDAAQIEYELVEYTVDEHIDAVSVANKIGADPDRVFKTLVAKGEKSGVEVFCIPGGAELDLKKAARLTGNKRVEMVPADSLKELTGYIRGGCSPIGMKRSYRIHIEETAILYPRIFISAGLIGMQLEINAEDLSNITDATLADLIRE